MRALVTGALGFVGRHLVTHLLASGDDVTVVDRRGDRPIDILDAEAVRATMAEVRPEAVYHLAGWADVGASWNDPGGVLRSNAEGTLHVLEACRRASVRRVLSVASADVYGIVTEADLPLTEESPMRPTSPYAASKVAADALAYQAFLGHGLGVLRVRPFNHLGPGQSENFVAPALAARIARAERDSLDEIPVGNLTPRRDVTDVRDVARAYRLLMEHGTPGEVYNVCSGRDLAIQELADKLVGLAKRPISLTPDPTLERPIDLPVLRGDASKLHAATGWEPEIPIEQTLVDLLEDLRTRVRNEALAASAHQPTTMETP
ncbi:MAG: GDP-mannose 4,6-dehydratase [Acidimicrobiales bacterium]|nr:GDP-mannose 4,6-dehydratase [Acidimicrobiales bacterium]